MFNDNKIYRFRIDVENNGLYLNPSGSFFIIYCQIKHIEKNDYTCQEYIYFPYDKSFTKAKEISKIQFDRIEKGVVFFKGPKFTLGPRKGKFDYWIMNPIDYAF